MTRLAWSAALFPVAFAGALWSCASDPGYLVVAVSSDMQTPKDIDTFAILVESSGTVKYDYVGRFPPHGSITLPATLVISQPPDPSSEVRIRLVGFRAGTARVVRDAITTVPSKRAALLRLPLDYLDDGAASGTFPPGLAAEGVIAASDFDPRSVGSRCDFGQRSTSIRGECASAVVDATSLPDYDPNTVSAPGPCFDAALCFGGATPVNGVEPQACAVTLPASPDRPRLALATHDGTGACADPDHCFVPLADDVVSAWSASGQATLVPGVCAKLAAGDRLYAGGACGPMDVAAVQCVGVGDSGADATLPEAGIDATLDAPSDAAPETSLPEAGDGEADGPELDAGPDCAAVLAKALASPIVPPAHWAGLDFSNGGVSSGTFGSGGTVLPADLLACADSIEPLTFTNGSGPAVPGYRAITAGKILNPALPSPMAMEVNRDSRVVYKLTLKAGYTGKIAFHSRLNGTWGTHSYVLGIDDGSSDAGGDAGGSDVLRDGIPFVPQLAPVNGGQATAWANEIYDGLMATFMPGMPAVSDCSTTYSQLYEPGSVLPDEQTNCEFTPAYGTNHPLIGVRPLQLYLDFDPSATRVSSIYTFWFGGVTTCGTPGANLERMDTDAVKLQGSLLPDGGYITVIGVGGLFGYPGVANPAAGLTEPEANAIECNGLDEPAPDPGYKLVQWGPSGEVALEYNPTTGVNYKLFARSGYPGTLFPLAVIYPDGGVDEYTVKLGTIIRNGAPVHIDWTSAATATVDLTAISNAWIGTWCGSPLDDECVAAGNCTITLDDGAGNSTLLLAASPALIANCGAAVEALGLVFAKGTSNLIQVYAVNEGGK